jgi:hypothetical protein
MKCDVYNCKKFSFKFQSALYLFSAPLLAQGEYVAM